MTKGADCVIVDEFIHVIVVEVIKVIVTGIKWRTKVSVGSLCKNIILVTSPNVNSLWFGTVG